MEMKDYMESTAAAVSPIFNAIRDSAEQVCHLEIDIHHWIRLENFILGREHNGWGPRNFARWRESMGEDPTVESVRFWRGKLESMLVARRESVNTLCTSVLMIAQTGIKLTLGSPSAWKKYEGTIISLQNECGSEGNLAREKSRSACGRALFWNALVQVLRGARGASWSRSPRCWRFAPLPLRR